MVFTSLPLYHLDPPTWNQYNQHQVLGNDSSHQLLSQPPVPNQAQPAGSGGGGGSRPGSMAERARMAKVPQPEQALKCPRCDSANTKFCYFNNYSLTQPRHFCKACRRYWTRGGALRNVPVGGGCRRNKRSGSSGKSAAHSNRNPGAAPAAASSCSAAASGSAVITSNFLSSLHPLADHFGLNFTSMQQQQQQQVDAGDYQVGTGTAGCTDSAGMGLDQWRIQQFQQFPFMGGMDGPTAGPLAVIYPNFDGEYSKAMSSPATSRLITQLASVKMEDSLPRQWMPVNDQYLGGGAWGGDLSGFNSPLPGNIL